ncbi:MAG TPA: inorganic diphosphatase [Candidatus Dormibacteraeota bacterium]|nr:inorganic diphosphatase [Candidatus Dormibacteraeota bacterium]
MPELDYGPKAPDIVNVIIEIRRGERNKYEVDKASGRLFLDRVNATSLGYPADYGYVPSTLCQDGDPLDALLIIDESVPHQAVVPSRAIGVLYFEDDGEMDEKLIVVAADDISKEHIKQIDDLGPNFKKVVEHFYAHYKDWKNNWNGVKGELKGWGDATAAKKVITESIERQLSH